MFGNDAGNIRSTLGLKKKTKLIFLFVNNGKLITNSLG